MSRTDQKIIERIHAAYYGLSASERKIADFVLNRYAEVQFMSITQLAEECGVAEATVSRFCRSLDLKGFNAFKLELAKQSAQLLPQAEAPGEDSFRGRCAQVAASHQATLQQTVELLEEAAVSRALTLIQRAERVICMGQGASMLMANECGHLFSTVSNRFSAVTDFHTQLSAAATMTERDVLLLFSYSGSTAAGLETLQLAGERGAARILVTRFPKSPLAPLADVVLCCGSTESPFRQGSVSARIAQLMVIDVLYQEFFRQNRTQCEASLEQIAGALSGEHL